MQAILNGRVLMPDRVATGQALLFEERIIGLCAPGALPEKCEVIDAGG